jgi:hypothetical protein
MSIYKTFFHTYVSQLFLSASSCFVRFTHDNHMVPVPKHSRIQPQTQYAFLPSAQQIVNKFSNTEAVLCISPLLSKSIKITNLSFHTIKDISTRLLKILKRTHHTLTTTPQTLQGRSSMDWSIAFTCGQGHGL